MSGHVLLHSYTFGRTVIDVWAHGIDTVYGPFEAVWAEPQDTDAYRRTADDLGYADDVLLMCQEHEMAHTLLAVMAGLEVSPTMYGVATKQFWPHWRDEEAAVLAFQKFCRRAGVSILGDLPGRYMDGH